MEYSVYLCFMDKKKRILRGKIKWSQRVPAEPKSRLDFLKDDELGQRESYPYEK